MIAKSVAMASIAVALIGTFCSCAVLRGGITRQTIASEYYAIAEAYSDLEKYDKAIPYYKEAAKEKEYRNAARYGLGRMYGLTGEWETARDIFESLLKKDPNNELLETAYSYSLVSSGKADEAVPLYRTILHPAKSLVLAIGESLLEHIIDFQVIINFARGCEFRPQHRMAGREEHAAIFVRKD